MLRIARNLLGLIGAVLLMLALLTASFILWTSNPQISIGWFIGASGIIYTILILMALNR